MRYFDKFSRFYKLSAIILLNTLVFILLVNIVFYIAIKFKNYFFQSTADGNFVIEAYGIPLLKQTYPDLDEKSIKDLLNETWSRPYMYETFTQFRERPFNGRYVNVDINGFRIIKNQGPWPPKSNYFNIFLFGGSTTFGYGVPDDQTIASYLQEQLYSTLKRDVRVYNFGMGYYYSTQERILFEKLLLEGHIPDMAIFIDGLNEFYFFNNTPFMTERLTKFVNGETQENLLDKLPITRAARFLKRNIKRIFLKGDDISYDDKNGENIFKKEAHKGKYSNEFIVPVVVERYLKNKSIIEAISAASEIQSIFVWQPISIYKYDWNFHLFSGGYLGRNRYANSGYQYMSELKKEKFLGNNFFWCADIQEYLKEPLYVDQFHYNAKMSKILAFNIADLLIKREFLTEKRE